MKSEQLLDRRSNPIVCLKYDMGSNGLPSRKPLENSGEGENPMPDCKDKKDMVDGLKQSTFDESIRGDKHCCRADCGVRACLVMVSSFLCNGIIFGTINSGGVFYVALKATYEEEGKENPATLASLSFSLAIGVTFFLSIVSGILTDKIGIRITTAVGGLIGTLGLFLSSFYYKQPVILALTMGVLFGAGSSLAYTPSLVILGHYFTERLGVVNGFVTAGSSIFTIVIPEVTKLAIEAGGLRPTFQMLTLLMSFIVFCGFIFKPVLPQQQRDLEPVLKKKSGGDSKCQNCLATFINVEIWKNKRYVIWAITVPSALFGYFVPYVHLMEYANTRLGPETNSKVLVQCIGVTSLLGRLSFGHIADKPWVDKIMLQQIAFFCIGSLTMLLTVASQFWMFVVITLAMGLFDGCFISLLGPIAFDIVGRSGASQAIGCLLAICSVPLTTGPYLAGVLFDELGSYVVPFLCAGVPPIFGAMALFLMRCVDPPSQGEIVNGAAEEKLAFNGVLTPSTENEALISSEKSSGNELLKVDVKQLAKLQRESSV